MGGDLAYGGAWAAIAYLACLGAGAIAGPPSLAAGGAALLTLALGLVITYYLAVAPRERPRHGPGRVMRMENWVRGFLGEWRTVLRITGTSFRARTHRQILLYTFPLNALGDSFSALLLFAFAITRVHLAWTPPMALYLAAAVVGGMLLEAAVQTNAAILALRFTIPIAVFMWFDRMIATFGNYPFSILPLAARAVLTYVLPIAFVAYLPAAVLTGRVASTGVPEWLAYASPAAGPLLYVLARYAWYRALRRYESVGG
jgi:ABC-2 family transporter protein